MLAEVQSCSVGLPPDTPHTVKLLSSVSMPMLGITDSTQISWYIKIMATVFDNSLLCFVAVYTIFFM